MPVVDPAIDFFTNKTSLRLPLFFTFQGEYRPAFRKCQAEFSLESPCDMAPESRDKSLNNDKFVFSGRKISYIPS